MKERTIEKYIGDRRLHLILGLVLALLSLIMILVTVNLGVMNLGFEKSTGIILAKLTNHTERLAQFKANEIAVVWDIRIPRILSAFLVGCGLSVAGTIFQSLLRNPLADPYTLGVSSGAAFGACLAIYLNLAYGRLLPTVPFAIAFALCTLLAVILIAAKGGGLYSSSLVIGGIIVSSIFSSGISILKMLAGENVSAIIFWLMGSFSAKRWSEAVMLLCVIPVCILLSWVFADDLDIMTLGEDTAKGLGINTKRTRFFYLVLGAVLTAVCVSVSGIIGFVGLVVPHLLRFRITSANRALIPLSALLGGFLLLLADNITRVLTAGEVPVGVLTTLLGGPFFIYVFLKKPKGGGA